MSLKPDDEKLIFLSTQPTRRKEEVEKLLDGTLGWNEILKTAFSMDLVPLLNYGLSPFYKNGKIPTEIIHTIKDKVRFVTGLNLGYFSELKELVRRFDRAGIPVCLIKGASVAIPVYGSISLRSFGDIDLLIKRDDLEKSIKVFGEEYEPDFFLPTLGMCKKYHFHISLSRKKTPAYCFEIHWALFTPDSLLNLPDHVLWKDTERFGFEGVYFRILSPENTFLHSVIHFTRNAFSSPRDLWDMHWLITRRNVNLMLLKTKSEDFRLEKRVAVCLAFIDCFFGTSYIQETGFLNKLKGLDFILKRLSISFLVQRKENSNDDIRALIAFLLQDGNKLSFLKQLVYPGIYWLTVYPPDLAEITIKVRIKIALRGIRLCFRIFLFLLYID